MPAKIAPYQGQWNYDVVKHLLKRTMFGARHDDIEYFVSLGLQASLGTLLRRSEIRSYPVNFYATNGEDPGVPFGQTWVNKPINPKFNFERTLSHYFWWQNRITFQDRNITEKLVLFWHNHFGVAHTNNLDPRTCFSYYNTLLGHGFGNFRDLIWNITKDPLMLTFLNGFENTARLPDENYARELMELFTLGKGPESKYTEKDVQEAAKVLTGMVFDFNSGRSDFHMNRHNVDDKVFSSFFDNTVIKGNNDPTKWEVEMLALIDMILKKEEVSKHICRKLYRFFVNYEINETIESQIIEPLAEIFRQSNYQIVPVLYELLSSEHFYSDQVVGSMIKSPADFYYGLLREMQPNISQELIPNTAFFEYSRKLIGALQQYIFDPPSVAGWPAYYQIPIFYKYWINSETLKIRSSVIDVMVDKNAPRNTDVYIDLLAYTKQIKGAEDPNVLIDRVLKSVFSFEPTDELKKELKKILLSNQDLDIYWTEAWNSYLLNPTDAININTVQTRLKEFYSKILHLREYNLH